MSDVLLIFGRVPRLACWAVSFVRPYFMFAHSIYLYRLSLQALPRLARKKRSRIYNLNIAGVGLVGLTAALYYSLAGRPSRGSTPLFRDPGRRRSYVLVLELLLPRQLGRVDPSGGRCKESRRNFFHIPGGHL